MTTNDFKGDFFEDQLPDEKGRKGSFFGRYAEQRYLPQVRVPIEYTAVIAIGVLIAIIVAYAIGVERGKTIPYERNGKSILRPAAAEDEAKPFFDAAMVEKQAEELMEKAEKPAEPAPLTQDVATKGTATRTDAGSSSSTEIAPAVNPDGTVYQLQLASTKNEEYAEIEAAKLKSKGFEASISQKGDWFKIYLTYFTKEEAERTRKKLSGEYKDCLIVKSKQ